MVVLMVGHWAVLMAVLTVVPWVVQMVGHLVGPTAA